VLLGVSMAAVGLALGLLIGRWWAVLFAIPVAPFFQPKMSARSRTLRSVSSLEYRWPSASGVPSAGRQNTIEFDAYVPPTPAPRLELHERWAARMFPRARLARRGSEERCGPPSVDPRLRRLSADQQLVSSSRTCLLAGSCAHPRLGTACTGQRALPLGLPQTRQGLRGRFMVPRLSAFFCGVAGSSSARARASCELRSAS